MGYSFCIGGTGDVIGAGTENCDGAVAMDSECAGDEVSALAVAGAGAVAGDEAGSGTGDRAGDEAGNVTSHGADFVNCVVPCTGGSALEVAGASA